MWETIKDAVANLKEALGIEIPGLPADLGAVGETVTGAVGGITESATTALDGLGAVGQTAVGGLADAANAVSGLPAAAVDSATQAVPDIPGALGSGS